MTSEELKKNYGDEYPAAVMIDGMRLPLRVERRFSRYYHSRELKYGCTISRFMDGSASITAPELQAEWHKWTRAERLDLCQNSSGADQADYPDMLRFIMEHGGPSDWSAIALSVAGNLPNRKPSTCCFELSTALIRAVAQILDKRSPTQKILARRRSYANTSMRYGGTIKSGKMPTL